MMTITPEDYDKFDEELKDLIKKRFHTDDSMNFCVEWETTRGCSYAYHLKISLDVVKYPVKKQKDKL